MKKFCLDHVWLISHENSDEIPKKSMVDLLSPGIKIFNYHAIDIYYNTYNHHHREQIKRQHEFVTSLEKNDDHLRNNKVYGIRSHFIDLVDYIKNHDFHIMFCRKVVRFRL